MPQTIRLIPLLLLTLLLSACSFLPQADPLNEGQTAAQLHLQPEPDSDAEQPLIAAWIPYFSVEALLAQEDEQTCVESVRNYLVRLKDFGINAVFVHICAFGESCCPSAYYPPMPGVHGHDGMQIFSEICSETGIAIHAWMNPLRLQTADYMDAQTGDALLCAWYRDSAMRAQRLSQWEKRFYLNPAAESTAEFLSGFLTELITRYHPAGIHVDDYFYPTTEPAFDAEVFAASGADDLAAWRTGNITLLMQRLYQAVKAADPDTVFSVSPQGNLQYNAENLYADVSGWCKSGDCCDLIIPQLYFGYRHESCPFPKLLREWVSLPRASSVRMAAGLGIYKYGEEDARAGSGKDEWCTTDGLPAAQAADALSEPALRGAVFYHADALLELPQTEAEALKEAIHAIFPAE